MILLFPRWDMLVPWRVGICLVSQGFNISLIVLPVVAQRMQQACSGLLFGFGFSWSSWYFSWWICSLQSSWMPTKWRNTKLLMPQLCGNRFWTWSNEDVNTLVVSACVWRMFGIPSGAVQRTKPQGAAVFFRLVQFFDVFQHYQKWIALFSNPTRRQYAGKEKAMLESETWMQWFKTQKNPLDLGVSANFSSFFVTFSHGFSGCLFHYQHFWWKANAQLAANPAETAVVYLEKRPVHRTISSRWNILWPMSHVCHTNKLCAPW